MWQEYFKIVNLKPGRVITALLGEVDFSNPKLPLETIKKLYENDFPYLELTPKGEKELYGVEPEQTIPEISEASQPIPEEVEASQPTPEEVEAPKTSKPRKKKSA